MMVVKVIIFIVTTTIAKHHHSNLDPKDNFFGNIYVSIYSVVNNLFESIDLGKNFTNQSNTKLLLTMHHDLKNIAETIIETYTAIQKIIKEDVNNQSYFKYSLSKSEEYVVELDPIINDILNKRHFDVYRAIKGTKHKHAKDKIKQNDKTEDKDKNKDKSMKVNVTSAFDDSIEFIDFVINFLTKVNNLAIQDFKKSVKNGRHAVPSKKNIKAWDVPSSLIFDLEEGDTRRIFGGSKAHVNTFPFIVSIHIMGGLTCSGCIISRDFVITAATCLSIAYKNIFFEKNLKSIYIRLGSDYTKRGGETIPVENLYFHPEYEPKTLKNNLAIIRLEKRFRFTRKQKKVRRILWDKTPGGLPNDTKEILILGWGATKKDQATQKNPKLRVSMLNVTNTTDCRKKYTEDLITKENFCAAFNGTKGSACNGDVGGPGIVGRVLMGVVSFGALECGAASSPTVFTKLGYYAPWIESVINANNRTNQTYNGTLNTRRKYKHSNKIRFQDSKSTYDRKDYPEDGSELRDTLKELVQGDQSMVHDVIYGDMYDEISKLFKTNEETDKKGSLRVRENHPSLTAAPFFEFKIDIVTDPQPTVTTQTPMSSSFKTLYLRKPPGDSDYETDDDALQNDYSDNYEKSSDEEHGLSIEVPTTSKNSLRNQKHDSDEKIWSSNSESNRDIPIAEESIDYSEEIRNFFALDLETTKNKNNFKTRDVLDYTRSILRHGKGKAKSNEVGIKRDKLSKHASSVLEEGKSLATKTFVIDFGASDVQVAHDKHEHKNSKDSSRHGKDTTNSQDMLVPGDTVSQSFFLQF